MSLTHDEQEELKALEIMIPVLKEHIAEVDAAIELHENELEDISAVLDQEMSAIDQELDAAEVQIRAQLEEESAASARTALAA